jgi:hypothetical protein
MTISDGKFTVTVRGLQTREQLGINYMTGEDKDYTVRSKVYKLDEESDSWELETSLNGYFLVDPTNSDSSYFLAEYQN